MEAGSAAEPRHKGVAEDGAEIDDSVAAWLYEVRQHCEQECTNVLIASSVAHYLQEAPPADDMEERAEQVRLLHFESALGGKCVPLARHVLF